MCCACTLMVQSPCCVRLNRLNLKCGIESHSTVTSVLALRGKPPFQLLDTPSRRRYSYWTGYERGTPSLIYLINILVVGYVSSKICLKDPALTLETLQKHGILLEQAFDADRTLGLILLQRLFTDRTVILLPKGLCWKLGNSIWSDLECAGRLMSHKGTAENYSSKADQGGRLEKGGRIHPDTNLR